MASGKGKLSRLYKMIDGCKTWKLILKNRDKEGFWDALYFDRNRWGWLLGDPVRGSFALLRSDDSGKSWTDYQNKGLKAEAGAKGAFAARNSSLVAFGGFVSFGVGGENGGTVYSVLESSICFDDCS